MLIEIDSWNIKQHRNIEGFYTQIGISYDVATARSSCVYLQDVARSAEQYCSQYQPQNKLMVEADTETVLTPTGDPYPPYPQSISQK